jgi:predicted porin
MKKSLIALAALAAAGAASAQSSVTLFGIVDVNYAHYSVSGVGHVNLLTNSGYNSSRLGFRGTEDLGGGLAASFWLEGALNPDVGQGTSQTAGLDFKRRSTVSLSGNWGEVRLGRDYTPTFWNMTVFDPFGTNGVGTQIGFKAKIAGGLDPNAVRANNMMQYFLPPNLGGFYGQVSYAFDEIQGSNDAGQYWGGRLGWASGPFNVAGAYGETKGSTPAAAATPKVKTFNFGGQWDFGMAKLIGEYDDNKYESAVYVSNPHLKSWLIGGLIPVGAGEIRVSYGSAKVANTGTNEPKADQWAIGYVHNLSKRTALYATYAHLKNKDGSALPIQASLPQSTAIAGNVNSGTTGFDLGIRHSF